MMTMMTTYTRILRHPNQLNHNRLIPTSLDSSWDRLHLLEITPKCLDVIYFHLHSAILCGIVSETSHLSLNLFHNQRDHDVRTLDNGVCLTTLMVMSRRQKHGVDRNRIFAKINAKRDAHALRQNHL